MFARRGQLERALSQGIASLLNQQQPDGSFFSFSSPQKDNFSYTLTFNSTFTTSLILDSLHTLPPTASLKKIKKNASMFLLQQKSAYWSFNYWARNSDEAKKMPYPDDLDDTVCALAALFHYDNKLLNGGVLAHVVQLLTAVEVKEGGPYRTWIVSETAAKIWKDIDIAVNSNIAYFLSLLSISLPSLTDFVEENLANNTLFSPYYPSEVPIIFFISRFYKGKYNDTLKNLLLAKRNSNYNWGNPLNTALAINALCNIQAVQEINEKSILYLLQSQRQGFWRPYAFYTGVNPKRDQTYYAGSSALTTAFCLEALNNYIRLFATYGRGLQKKSETHEALLHRAITQRVKNKFLPLDKTIYKNTHKFIDELLKKDPLYQITLLPYYFAKSLTSKNKDITDEFLITLGEANLYGWIAYTIYDDFLDEKGDPHTLAIANIALRALCEVYETILPQQPGFVDIFHTIMDNLDSANAWEVRNCVLFIKNRSYDFNTFVMPDFLDNAILAKKSLGHALGPIAILFYLGYNKKSPEVQNLLLFFKHYLIARQLNDDAHDWEQDLLHGHINAVSALLMRTIFKKGGPKSKKISIKRLLASLQKVFWHTTIDEVCVLVNEHIKNAKTALSNCTAIIDYSLFENLLAPHERAAKMALEERENALKFFDTYTTQ